MTEFRTLAFVDIETTGLSPAEDRVAEIGVITVDADRVERWSTLVRTPCRCELDSAAATHERAALLCLLFCATSGKLPAFHASPEVYCAGDADAFSV